MRIKKPLLASFAGRIVIGVVACLVVMACVTSRPRSQAFSVDALPSQTSGSVEGFEGVVTYRYTGGLGRVPKIFEYAIKGTKVRAFSTATNTAGNEPPISTIILDGHTDTMIVVSRQIKKVVVRAYTQKRATTRLDSVMKHAVKTGSETIAGVLCDNYQGTDINGKPLTMCIAHGMGTFIDFDMMGGPQLLSFGPFEGFPTGFFPLRLGEDLGDGRNMQWVAIKIERKSLDDSLFAIPSGFTTTSYGLPGEGVE